MTGSKFTYVTYIRATPAKVWKALTNPKIIEQYWFGLRIESDWKQGSKWKFYYENELMDSGKITKIVPNKLLVRSWNNEWVPKLKAEGTSRCVYELERMGSTTKLTITHSIARKNSKFIEAVSEGWPMCISNLKSLIETGQVALLEHPGHGD